MPQRPLLLVSVRNAQEAKLALAGGADIIDIKEPAHGPLGQADPAIWLAIEKVIAHQATLSIALGELVDHPSPSAVLLELPRSAQFIKIGLQGMAADPQGWSNGLLAYRVAYPQAKLVAVAYWDAPSVNAPSPQAVLDWAIAHQAAAFLIDTADKQQPGLLASPHDQPRLQAMLAQAQSHHLPVALAGRLVDERLRMAIKLNPDIIGVRSAACHGHDRQQIIDLAKVMALKKMLQP